MTMAEGHVCTTRVCAWPDAAVWPAARDDVAQARAAEAGARPGYHVLPAGARLDRERRLGLAQQHDERREEPQRLGHAALQRVHVAERVEVDARPALGQHAPLLRLRGGPCGALPRPCARSADAMCSMLDAALKLHSCPNLTAKRRRILSAVPSRAHATKMLCRAPRRPS
jgi:hypothetical protein